MGMVYMLRKLRTEERHARDISVYLVTGGSSGIGLELSRILYHRGGRVFIDDLANAKKGTIEFVKIDLSDLKTVKSAASEIHCKTDRLDVVWYNAGLMLPSAGSKTKQVHMRNDYI
ncbi:hypothetical protein V1515DRAFT_583153 [Lipomyces mesembrius]